VSDLIPRFASLPAIDQELIVRRFKVPDSRKHSKPNGLIIEGFRGGRPTYPAAVL
jgi:hypothetical protein